MINISEKMASCPICQNTGQKVNRITVVSLLKQELINVAEDEDYFICLSRHCPTSYYTERGAYFSKEDLTVPIWFKEESPVPICYCKDVTDHEIQDHVTTKQCCADLKDIQLHTGANTGKECLTKNPTGK